MLEKSRLRAFMRDRVIAALGFVAIGLSAVVHASQPACQRRCLEEFADRYFTAMQAHDASKIRGSARAKYTENTVRLKSGRGLWATFTGLGSYRIYAADPTSGQVVFMGTVRENGDPAILALRLKVVMGRLQEAEAIVHRNADEARELESRGQPDSLWSADAESKGPAPTDAKLTYAADLYFTGLLAHNGKLVPFADGCNRIVDGVQDTNNPKDRGFMFGNYNPAELSCSDNVSSPVWSYQESIEPRRYLVVDKERGLVFAVLMFNHPGNILSAEVPGIGKVPMPKVVMRPSTVEIADLFKIDDGKISRLEAVSAALPYLQPDGWSVLHN